MRLYRRGALFTLLHIAGSPIIPALPFALSCTVASLIYHNLNQATPPWSQHPYTFQLFAAVVGFGLVFRAQLAYARYWESRTALASLGSKWTDAALQITAFSSPSSPNSPPLIATITHQLSLLHALTLQSLRNDSDVNNLSLHTPSTPPPSLDIARVANLPPSRKFKNLFITSHNDNPKLQQQIYCTSKFPVVGILTPRDLATTLALQTNNERISHLMQQLLSTVMAHVRDNTIDAPPPIVSRVFQVLSEGHERGVFAGRKVAETPFPLPFAMVIEFLVLTFICGLPFILGSYLTSYIAIGVLSFLTSLAYVSLNVVGRMLEEPFGADHNDLPLCYLQWEFNKRLLATDIQHNSRNDSSSNV